MKKPKYLYWVDFDEGYSVTFLKTYTLNQPQTYGECHGPYKTLAEAKKSARGLIKHSIDEWKGTLISIRWMSAEIAASTLK